MEGEIGDDPLLASVLGLELLQSLRVVDLHATILSLPTVPGRLGDLELTTYLGEILALVEQFVALSEFSDHLFGGVVPLLQDVLLAPFGASGLSLEVDHFRGIRAR